MSSITRFEQQGIFFYRSVNDFCTWNVEKFELFHWHVLNIKVLRILKAKGIHLSDCLGNIFSSRKGKCLFFIYFIFESSTCPPTSVSLRRRGHKQLSLDFLKIKLCEGHIRNNKEVK